jgi:hypothetical protein
MPGLGAVFMPYFDLSMLAHQWGKRKWPGSVELIAKSLGTEL